MPIDFNQISLVSFVQDALEENPSDTKAQRLKIYEDLRDRIRNESVVGMSTEKTLEKLNSTIARQDVFLGYFDLVEEKKENIVDEKSNDQGLKLKLPEIVVVKESMFSKLGKTFGFGEKFNPNKPPGPKPSSDDGPISDHVYISIDMLLKEKKVAARFSYNYDPCCNLTLEIVIENDERLFEFQTRAASFAFAFEHLRLALMDKGFAFPIVGLQSEVKWVSDKVDEECVLDSNGNSIFALDLLA